jgi:hypothetical protein
VNITTAVLPNGREAHTVQVAPDGLSMHRITHERDVSVDPRTEHLRIGDHDTSGRG